MRRVLVLNRSWEAISIWTLQKAISKLFSYYKNGEPKAVIIDVYDNYAMYSWDDWEILRPDENEEVIRTPHTTYRVPEIIRLNRYDKKFSNKIKFSKRTLFKRDAYTCMYCGKQPNNDELTIDHIIPKSKGGETNWVNCVISCIKCNFRKGDKSLEEVNMRLLKVPAKPKTALFQPSDIKKESWKQFITFDKAYEIQND